MNRSTVWMTGCIALSAAISWSSACAATKAASLFVKPNSHESHNCFDTKDEKDIRLWEGRAPGATGDDPCRDIPFLRIFPGDASEDAKQPAIIIIPGGGYSNLSNEREQVVVAKDFVHTLHVTAFILYYRTVREDGTYRYPVPMWDGQRSIKLIRAQADKLGIDKDRVALFGFSAGGHLASSLALHSGSDFDLPVHDQVDQEKGKPTLLGLGYPVISMDPADVPPSHSYTNLLRGYEGKRRDELQSYLSSQKHIRRDSPPVFLFESMDDKTISPMNSVLFIQALQAAGASVEPHMFQHGQHGAGLAEGAPEEGAWPGMFHRWLIEQHFISR